MGFGGEKRAVGICTCTWMGDDSIALWGSTLCLICTGTIYSIYPGGAYQLIYFLLLLVIECLHYKIRASELSSPRSVIDGEIMQFKANVDHKMTVNACRECYLLILDVMIHLRFCRDPIQGICILKRLPRS